MDVSIHFNLQQLLIILRLLHGLVFFIVIYIRKILILSKTRHLLPCYRDLHCFLGHSPAMHRGATLFQTKPAGYGPTSAIFNC